MIRRHQSVLGRSMKKKINRETLNDLTDKIVYIN